MSYFAVIREAGSTWTGDQGVSDQPALGEHTAFMNALADDGFVLFGGPLSGSEDGRIRVLLIIDAASEREVHDRLRDDPWALAQRLATVSVEPWNLFVGAQRLSPARPPEH